MLLWLTVVVFAAAAALALVAALYGWRERPLDDRMLLVAAVLEVAVLVQAVVVLTHLGGVAGGSGEKATFAAYGVTLPFVPAAVAFLALKEKTRWSMGVVVVGAFAVAVMTGRLQQIWELHA